MAKSDTAIWMNINAQDFGKDFVDLVAEEKEIYAMLKANRAKQVQFLNDCTELGDQYVVTGVMWTRWGQHQAKCDKPTAKIAKTPSRPSLGDWLKLQQANGKAT